MEKKVFSLAETPIDFLVASAYKLNGSKGVGFAFILKNTRLEASFLGGEQEKVYQPKPKQYIKLPVWQKRWKFVIKIWKQTDKKLRF